MLGNNGGGRKADNPIKGDDRAMTLQEIAETMGCTRERVRQIEQRALSKLRRKLRALGYEPDDFLGQLIDTPARPTRIRPE